NQLKGEIIPGNTFLPYVIQMGLELQKMKKKHLYLKSAEGGNHSGQKILGYFYENGIGTIKDEEKAFQWYLKSAEGGDHSGQYNLGDCYENGIGTTKDEEKAFQWYLNQLKEEIIWDRINLGDIIKIESEPQKMRKKHSIG